MKLGSLALAALAALLLGCGGTPKPVQLAPLPDDKPAEPAKPDPAPDAEDAAAKPPEAEPPAPPPAPKGPLEAKLPTPRTTVKLVAKGTGKLAPLRYAGKAGGKQQVEIALDFASTESKDGQSRDLSIPTIVLRGEAETRAIDKDGKADYAITVAATDARDVAGAAITTADLKQMIGSLAGLVIGGSVAGAGPTGDVTLRVDKPDHLTSGALEMVRMSLPPLPVLPAEPIGVGAKWQTTTATTLADKLPVTQITDYELVAAKGGTFTIKGKTSVTGLDQELHGGKLSGIRGSGQSELVLTAGALVPTYKAALETQFTASEGGESITLKLRLSGGVTAK